MHVYFTVLSVGCVCLQRSYSQRRYLLTKKLYTQSFINTIRNFTVFCKSHALNKNNKENNKTIKSDEVGTQITTSYSTPRGCQQNCQIFSNIV